MRSVILICLIGFAFAQSDHVERKESPHHEPSGEKEHEKEHEKDVGNEPNVGFKNFKIDARTKEILLKEKYERPEVFLTKAAEFFLANPNREFERQCFAKFKPGESVDFVIDIAPSPELDKFDKLIAESPISYYLSLWHKTATRIYFDSIRVFIDTVTYDMKPEFTHSIIYEKGRKFYIRGRQIETVSDEYKKGDFIDVERNLKTMWPVETKSVPSGTFLRSVLKNNLGRMTKLALWNRDNGLATVLNDKRRSKPVYTIVITDGASGAKLSDLCDDVTQTTVIDIGNRRFVNNINWDDMRRLVTVVSLNAPQELLGMADTCRLMACKACGC